MYTIEPRTLDRYICMTKRDLQQIPTNSQHVHFDRRGRVRGRVEHTLNVQAERVRPHIGSYKNIASDNQYCQELARANKVEKKTKKGVHTEDFRDQSYPALR